MSEVIAEIQKRSVPEWLVRAWRHHGKTTQFDLDMQHWLEEYPDLSKLIEASNGSILEAWPVRDIILADGETFAAYTIKLRPRTLEQLKATREKPGPKIHATQITTSESTKYNTRRRREEGDTRKLTG